MYFQCIIFPCVWYYTHSIFIVCSSFFYFFKLRVLCMVLYTPLRYDIATPNDTTHSPRRGEYAGTADSQRRQGSDGVPGQRSHRGQVFKHSPQRRFWCLWPRSQTSKRSQPLQDAAQVKRGRVNIDKSIHHRAAGYPTGTRQGKSNPTGQYFTSPRGKECAITSKHSLKAVPVPTQRGLDYRGKVYHFTLPVWRKNRKPAKSNN